MAITTKAGLLGNLRNLKWFADCDCDEVLPRGYDLSVDIEVQARNELSTARSRPFYRCENDPILITV